MKRKRHILLLMIVVCLLGTMASASIIGGPKYDEFGITLEGDNEISWGTGSGWNNADWIYYDQTNWWNQWFYDDPPSADRMKHIEYTFTVSPLLDGIAPDDMQITVDVALNWSTMEYPPTGASGPPPTPDQEWAIQREVVYEGTLTDPGEVQVDGSYDIWDYNPEWVSIDVRVYAWGFNTWIDEETGESYTDRVALQVDIIGDIMHECIIPEPATLLLLSFGGLGLMKKARA